MEEPRETSASEKEWKPRDYTEEPMSADETWDLARGSILTLYEDREYVVGIIERHVRANWKLKSELDDATKLISKLDAYKSQADRIVEYLQTSNDAPEVKVSNAIERWAEWLKVVGD